MLDLKIFRSRLKGLPDLLNYAACIAPGIYMNKDGSLSAAFSYRSSDAFSAVDAQRNVDAKKMNDILLKFGSGWAFHIDAIRRPIIEYSDKNRNFFPDPVCKMIDEERREFFSQNQNLYETVNIVTLTYMAVDAKQQKLSDMMYDDDHSSSKSDADRQLVEFQDKIDQFYNLSKNITLEIRKMLPIEKFDQYGKIHYEDPYLSYVNYCLVGRWHPVHLPDMFMYLDRYIGAYDFVTGVIPRIDDQYISIVAIEGFPQESYPNMLDALSTMDMQYRWSSRFIFMDRSEAIGHLKKLRGKWKQKEQGFITAIFNPHSTKVDAYAREMVHEVDTAIAEVNSSMVAYGYYTNNLVIMDADRESLDNKTKEIVRSIESMGFNTRVETINAVEAWMGTLPGHVMPNVRRSLVSSFNLSHMMPMSSVWIGDKYNANDKFPPSSPALMYTTTDGSTPFRLNLHVGDLGHTLIFGPTGSGKSTLLASIVAQFRRYPGAKIFAFDKGMSLFALAKAAGGDHFDVAGDGGDLSFAPLSELSTVSDQAWAESWIATMLELQNVVLTPIQKGMIHDAMEIHIHQNGKSLTEFISNLQDEDMRAALGHYSISGPMGHLLDAESDRLHMSSFAVFEIEELMNLKHEDAMPVLLYLFYRIEKYLDGKPALLVLDEAWLMLGHSAFRDKIKEWFKVLRKANCSVVLATQSLSDAAHSGILDVLQESCPTKIMLPNVEAFNKGTDNNFGPYDFYRQFGLNDRQIEIITNAIPKREYYYFSPLGTRLFNLALGEVILAFVGASNKSDVETIKVLIDEFGEDGWVPHWLYMRGIDPEVYYNSLEQRR